MQQTNSKAVIVWIDDYFISEEFENKEDKNIYWDELFGRFSSKVYRLMDISIVIKGTREEGMNFLKNISAMDGVYYFCILDMYLPLSRESRQTEVEYSKDIAKVLLKKGIDFAFLSSASKLSGESDQALQSVDFYTKAKNKDFNLPVVLRQKILHQIKKNVHWLDIKHKLVDKLAQTDSHNIKSQLDNTAHSSLFPFIDGFRDFIEFSEFEEIPFHQTLFIRSSKSASAIYEMQCLLLMLSNQIYSNEKFTINYKKVTRENFTRIEEDLDSAKEALQCFRLKDITLKQFQSINKKSTGKQRVYIIDTDDLQIEDYMNEIGAFTLKDIPSIQMSNDTLRTEILLHTLKHMLNSEADTKKEQKVAKSKNIYFHHPKLLIDPVDYIKFTDHSLNIKTLDDPNEIISQVYELYEDSVKKVLSGDIVENMPLIYTEDWKPTRYEEDDQILVKAMVYWLSNSWSMHYGIDIETFKRNHDHNVNIEQWRVESFKTLVKISRSIKRLDNKESFKIPLIQINTILKSKLPELILNHDTDNALDVELELLTKIKWPHKYFPIPLIAHERLEKHGKTFWLQHNSFNNIEYSEDLKHDFKYLDQKIEYYDKVLKLIETTVEHLPSSTHDIINKITTAIRREEQLVIDAKFKEDFKSLSNIFIRIVLNFGLLVNKSLQNVGYNRDEDDKAKLGTHVATIRDRLLVGKQDIFVIDNESILNDDDGLTSNMNFILQHTKLLSDSGAATFYNCISTKVKDERSLSISYENIQKTSNLFKHAESYKSLKAVVDVGDTNFEKGQSVSDKELEDANSLLNDDQVPATATFDSPQAYLDSILRTDNANAISQISNLSKFLNQNDLLMQIVKNMNTVKLLSYMADTRNSWEHKTGEDEYFYTEKFFEFFIFSYESIWNFYSFLIEHIDTNNDLLKKKSNYVRLTEDKRKIKVNEDEFSTFISDFPTKDKFDYYLNNLKKQ